MSANGPPFNVSDIAVNFGSGGQNVVPGQGIPNLRDLFKDLLGRIGFAKANAAALTATLKADRADGMLALTLDTYTLWVWKNASTDAPSATVIEPTDLSGAAGRWEAIDSGLPTAASVGVLKFSGTLVAGVSAPIACPGLAAGSKITVTRNGIGSSTGLGELCALTGNRVTGGSGSFEVTSEKTDGSGVQTLDSSTFDAIVVL